MDVGKYQLIISVSVILASAVVALLYDYLKRNNEALREANAELKARRARELKRVRMSRMAGKPLAEKASPTVSISEGNVSPEARGEVEVEILPSYGGPELTANMSSASLADSNVSWPDSNRLENNILEHLDNAMSDPRHDLSEMPASLRIVEVSTASEDTLSPALDQRAAAPATPSLDSGSGAGRNWGALLKSARPGPTGRNTRQHSEPSPKTASRNPAQSGAGRSLPAGLYPPIFLEAMLKTSLEVSGLVISIGFSAPDASGSALWIEEMVRSMLTGKDFAARVSDNEFLLILEETGAPAQRRLKRIAQQLWDHQIESLHSQPVAFVWGGLEVRKQPLAEAMSSATERMRETRRTRKSLPMDWRERGLSIPHPVS